MKFHDELNQIIFDKDNDNQMRPKVIAKLKEIANAFIEYLEIPEDAVLDMVVTGSSASYNYNKYSDLDLHIIVDYDKIHEDCPLVEGYLGALKNTFNKEHDIFIKDVPVELYAEKKDQGTVHNGLYSVQEEEWIDRPKKIPPTDNDAAVEAKFNEIKEMVDKCNDSEEATELLEKIYSMRKAGLAEAGEFCTENLAFKKLRNEGCMDKLRQIKKEQIDKQLSLESYNEASNEIEFDWDKIINLRKQGKIKSIRFGNIEIGDRLLTFNGMYCNGILKVEKKNTTYDSKGNFTYEVIGTREEPVGRDCGCNAYAYGDREFEIVDDDVSQSDIIKDKNESIKEEAQEKIYNPTEFYIVQVFDTRDGKWFEYYRSKDNQDAYEAYKDLKEMIKEGFMQYKFFKYPLLSAPGTMMHNTLEESIKEDNNCGWKKFGKNGEILKCGDYVAKIFPQAVGNNYIATLNIKYKKQPLNMQTFEDKEAAKKWLENKLPKNESIKESEEQKSRSVINKINIILKKNGYEIDDIIPYGLSKGIWYYKTQGEDSDMTYVQGKDFEEILAKIQNKFNKSIKENKMNEGFNKGDKVQLKRKNNKIGIVKSIFNGDKDKNDKDIKYLAVEFEDGTEEGRPASDFRKVNEDYDDIAVYNASEEELYELSAAIRKYGDGRYYINFHDKKNGEGNLTSCAGPYNTKKEAKQAMKRLRPDYTEIKAKNESIKEELEEKEYQGCKYTILPDGKYCSIKIYAPKGYSFKNGDTWYSTETELKKADKKAKDIIDNEIELKESIKESVQDLTVLTNEDKEYLTKRFSKMYKEDVVPTLINEVQHLLEVCDWYKSKKFIPMKVNGFLFSNKIEWEPCTIEEVQNDVGRKNLLVYLDRVSPGRDSLSTKTLKSRKNFIGSNSIEYKIEFKKDYKSIFRGNTDMNEDYIIDRFKEMANKIAADFKAEGYPKSDKYLLDFVEEAVKKFSTENKGYLLRTSTDNGEAVITLSDLLPGHKQQNDDGSIYQARINAERKTVKFTDLENSNYAYESLNEGKKRKILSDEEYAKFLLSYMSNDPTYEEVLNMLPMINDDLRLEEIKTLKQSKLKSLYKKAVELKKQGITESVDKNIYYYVIDKNGGMEGEFEAKSEANAWKRHYNKYNNLDIKNDYILITTTQLNKLEEIGIKDPKEIFKKFKKQNESIKEGLDKMINKAMNEEDLKAIWKNEMKREPIIDTPDGPIYLQPSEDGKSIEYGTMTNTGMIVDGSVEYDFDYPLDANLNAVYDEITDTYGLNTVSEEDRDLVCTQEKEDRLNSSFTEAAEGIYDPRTILKAYKIEQDWYKSLDLDGELAPEVMLFIIEDKEIKDTKLVKREDVYTYQPNENEYYLDRTRDSGDVITDYNLEPAQKLVKDWNEGKKWLDPEWLSNFMKEELEPVYHYSVEDIDQRGDDFDNAEEAYEQAKEQLSKLGYEVKELNDDGEFKVLSTSTGVAYTGVIYPSNPELDEDVATLTDKVDQADSDLRDIIDTISSSDLRESLDAVVKKASKGLNEDLDEPIEDEFELIRNALRKYSKSDEAFKDGFVTIDELKDLFSLYQFDIDDITECAKEEGYEIDGDKILDPSL